MSIVISLDIGTSKLCALAFDTRTRKPLAIRSIANVTDVAGLSSTWHEQDPQQIRDTCFTLVKDLLGDTAINSNNIVGIGFSGQMHGVLLVNSYLKLYTNLITWRDQRTLNIGTKLAINVAERTGCYLSAGYGGATLHWLQTNKKITPDMTALTIADYLVASLTGILATEPTHAASWGIFAVSKNNWDYDAIATLNIPIFVLPPVHPSATPIGKIKPEIAKTLGLPLQTQVCSPVGDNQASVIGVAGFNQDTMVLNLGTGGQVSVPSKEYSFSRQLETRPMPFGGFIQVGASLCGGWAHAYLCHFFHDVIKVITKQEINEKIIYNKINELIEKINVNIEELEIDTRFNGTRLDPSIRGSIKNITRENLTPSNLAYGIFKGMVTELLEFAQYANLDNIKKIMASGNAVRKNPIVQEIISKLFALPCHVGEVAEEAALGAALATALGLKLIKT